MKALITDTIKFAFFAALVTTYAGVATAITKVLRLAPHQAPHPV